MSTPTAPKGLLDLPRELRDEIYQYLLVKPNTTITMLSNYDCFKSEISAAQPALTKVNKQIRRETLPLFYRSNTFTAELSHTLDVEVAQRWLEAIGEENVRHLHRVAMSGWTRSRLDGGWCRYLVRVVFNLKAGTFELEPKKHLSQGPISTLEDSGELKEAFDRMMLGRGKGGMDGVTLGRLMEGFNEFCATY